MTALADAAAGLGTLVGYLKNAAFEPVLTGPLLYLLTRGPEPYRQSVRDVLLRPFSSADYSTNLVRGAYLIKTLKWLFALGLVSRVNGVLSAWAANHWRWTKQGVAWDFDEKTKNEIAIVTGGCSGFGLLISKGLAEKCKVVVMDVQELPEDLKNCMSKTIDLSTQADTVRQLQLASTNATSPQPQQSRRQRPRSAKTSERPPS